MNRLTSVAIFVLGLCAGLNARPTGVAGSADPAKPNIVIIVADDLGWNAVGYHNPVVKTPHLNRLCEEGVELDRFYVSPMCSPTRAGVMTGRYPIRFGCARAVIPPWRNFGVPTDEVMLPQALAKAGYDQRGAFGKWHMGHAQKKWLPNARGFTEFAGCYNGAIDYFTFERDGEPDWHHNEESVRPEVYLTEATGNAAVEFIGKAAGGNKPFLCYVPFNAPHSPFQAPEKYLAKYAGIEDKTTRTYYAMITAMDDQIGRILDAIKAAGIENDTVVWFFSDNGGVRKIRGNNAPLHGGKLTTFDGGVRAVACVRHPGVYPAGMKITEPTAFIDVLPTVLANAGSSPGPAGCEPLDGIDLNPLLSGNTKSLPARDLYFYHGQQGEESETIAIHSSPWKLVANGPSLIKGNSGRRKIQLYRISEDPNETRDVSEAHPEVADRLLKKLAGFRKLQPANAVPPYKEGRKGFKAPKDWKISQ